jgi:hypothetical protein
MKLKSDNSNDFSETKLENSNDISEINHSDDIISSNQETISLRDPLNQSRIVIAVKGSKCIHRQCFDLKTFLEYSFNNNYWNCPVCDKNAPYNELKIDDFVNKILLESNEDKVTVIGNKIIKLNEKKIEKLYLENTLEILEDENMIDLSEIKEKVTPRKKNCEIIEID